MASDRPLRTKGDAHRGQATAANPAGPGRDDAHTTAVALSLGALGAGRAGDARSTSALAAPSLVHMQRTAGNAAVARLLAARRRPSRPPLPVSRKASLDEEWSGPAPEADPDDVDVSEFTSDPRAAAELAKRPAPALPKPPAAPTGPPPPAKPITNAKVKPTAKPPKGPAKKAAGPAKRAAKRAAGEIVKKPVPPPPPKYRFVPGMVVPAVGAVAKRRPGDDPAFAKVVKAAKLTVKKAKQHPTGKRESEAAQLAAKAPPNDGQAQAEAAHADTMAAAKPKEFSADAFYTAMKAALEQARPKNLKEATAIEAKASKMQEAVKGTVDSSKAAAAADVKEKADQPPDPSKAVPKPEAPMTDTRVEEPGSLKASAAMPAPVPKEQVDFRAGPAAVDQEMADADVTEDQLRESNELAFGDALKAKKEGEAHADASAVEVRKKEAQILTKATGDAASAEKAAVGGATSHIGAALTKVGTGKDAAKTKDEAARKEVADNVDKIYAATKTDVDAILEGLDTKVEKTFEAEERQIREAFTADWNRRLAAYKSRRYSGLRGKWRWVRDKFKGLPEAANKEYEASQRVYEARMDKLARQLSAMVAGELNAATRRIQKGRAEVASYVGGLKGELARIGQEAAAELSEKFDDLDAGVKDKFDDLATALGKKYAESEEAVKKEIEEAKEANKGLIDKAIDAVKGVVNTIRNLKNLLLDILARAAGVIGDIVRAPIKFARNLFAAIKGGVQRFADNILDHLKRGLMGWLFGTLGAAGVEIPDTFDVKGVFQLVTSVLGVTWNAIRGAFVRRIGEPGVNALEKGSSVVQDVVKRGPLALIDQLLEKLPDFEDTVLGKIKDLIVDKVIVAGITFLVSMLNPASAFIKACKMIYDVVRWFLDNGDRIRELITAILDSVADIVRGGVGGVPEKIEGVLAKILPMAIGFFASLVGMGGIGKKVSEIVDRIRKPMAKAIDKVVDGITKLTKPIWGPIVRGGKKLYEKGKAKYEQGKQYVRAKYESGKKVVVDAATKAKDFARRLVGLPRTQPVDMAGASHTITMSGDGGNVKLVMASAPKDLFSKIAAENDIAEASGDQKRIAVARSMARLAGNIRQTGMKAVGADDEKVARKLAAKVPKLLERLAETIAKYARDYGVKDLGVGGAKAVKTEAEKLSGEELDRIALEAAALADIAKQHGDDRRATRARAIASGATAASTTSSSARAKAAGSLRTRLAALKAELQQAGAVDTGKGDEGLWWDRSIDGIVGEIGPHSAQGSRGRAKNGRPKALWLESEHVIPRAWINAYLVEAHNKAVTGAFYERMTTIMLYKGASEIKTNHDSPPAGAKSTALGAGSDNPVTARMKRVLSGIGGGGGGNAAALKDLRTSLRGLLDTRVDKTLDAVRADEAGRNGQVRKRAKAPAGPADSLVREAASRQLTDVEAYVATGEGARGAGSAPLKEFTEPFSMNGAGHELIWTPPGKLEMASDDRGLLVAKLERSLEAMRGDDSVLLPQRLQLGKILALARQVEDAMAVAESLDAGDLMKRKAPAELTKLQQLLARLSRSLVAYGERWAKTKLPEERDKLADGETVAVPDAKGKPAKDMAGETLYAKFGMPAANALHAMRVAGIHGVTILVRPTTPYAPVLLEKGLLPKPEKLKMKTIIRLDLVVGRNSGVRTADLGKVGYFLPEMPNKGTKGDEQEGVVERYVDRLKEFHDQRARVLKMEKRGTIRVEDGKIVDVRSGKQYTGDHDLYAILDATGTPLVDAPGETAMLEKKEAVVAALRGGAFKARHGAHLDWKPKNAVEQHIFDVVVKAHESGAPLLMITPDGCSVTYHKPTFIPSED